MVRWLIRVLIQAAVLGLIALLLPHWVSLAGAGAAVIAIVLISLASALIRPLLFVLRILTLPLSCLTLGLFSLALSFGANVLILWVVDQLLSGMTIHGTWPLLGTAFLLGLSHTLAVMLTHRRPVPPRP